MQFGFCSDIVSVTLCDFGPTILLIFCYSCLKCGQYLRIFQAEVYRHFEIFGYNEVIALSFCCLLPYLNVGKNILFEEWGDGNYEVF